MTSVLQNQIAFARFCIGYHIEPGDAAELTRLAHLAFNAGQRHACRPTEKTHKAELGAINRFREAATALGFESEWSGLWPILRKGNHVVNIPI